MSSVEPFPNLLPWVDTTIDLINLQFEIEVDLLLNTTTQPSYTSEPQVNNLMPYGSPIDVEE